MKTAEKFLIAILVVCMCVILFACGIDGKDERKSGSISENRTQSENVYGSRPQSGNVSGNSVTPSDPNGFSSKEELLDAYITMWFVRIVSKEEYRKIYPEQRWISGWEGSNFEEGYRQYKNSAESNIAKYKQFFDDDYHLATEIVSVEDCTDYRDFSEEERQECLDIFGVEPEDHHMYNIAYSVTFPDSNANFSNEIIVRKIGSKWYFY